MDEKEDDDDDDDDDDGEQPVAIAICDPVAATSQVCYELVFNGDIFWGTVYSNLGPHSTSFLTTRNNYLIEAVLAEYLGFLPEVVRRMIASLAHYHF